MLAVVVMVAGLAGPAGAHLVGDNLPGGTSIEVSIDSPADGAVLPAGPVTVTGTAAVGTGEPVANTALIYVVDVSGSTGAISDCPAGGDTVLDCEVAAAIALNQEAVALQTVGAVGAVGFATDAAATDVRPAAGNQLVTGPDSDEDGNTVPDVEQVLGSAQIGQITDFTTTHSLGNGTVFLNPIEEATTVAADPDNTMDRTIVAFLSDGFDGGPNIGPALAGVPEEVDFFTFAIGSGSQCAAPQNSLQQIADQTGGLCTQVPDVADLPDFLPGVIASELTSLTLQVDGDPGTPITDTAPSLPEQGPTDAVYTIDTGPLTAGTHELCVTANGSDGGGTGTVTDCHTITINTPPTVDPGGPYAGQEGAPVSLAGSVTDPDNPVVTTQWSVLPVAADPGTTCDFADPGAVLTTVACTDDGEFTLTLTADDGINPPVSQTAPLTLSNQAPVVSIAAPTDGVLVEAGEPVAFEAPFTDPGSNDTHTCTVDFDDGTPVQAGSVDQSAGSGTCTIDHEFTALGPHHVLVTVTDDDGDSGTAVVTVVVHLPAEAFAISANGPVTILKTPHATCPPDESLTLAALTTGLVNLDALNAECTVDPDTGATVASASVDEASLLGGVINITNIQSTCEADADGITRTSSVGTINGIEIGTGSGSITIPLVATIHFNETTTNAEGQLIQNAIRVQTLLGQQIILASCRLG
ncbi:MAG: choice-of-anchor P family protein [Natronosporangium sp.]